MKRRRRRKVKGTGISLLILAGVGLVVFYLPLVFAMIAGLIQDFRGVPHPRDFDPLIMLAIFAGLAADLLIIPAGLVWAILFWFRFTAPFDPTRCAKCGYDLRGSDEYLPTCPECGLRNEAIRQ